MPVHLKFLVNTITGFATAMNGCKKDDSRSKEDQEDPAEEKKEVYTPTRFQEKDLPSMVDMREFMTDIENQAGAGSCTANAVVGAFEYVMGRSGEKVDFSRLFVYYNARALYNNDYREMMKERAAETGEAFDEEDESWNTITDSGSEDIAYALESLWIYGVCREETWDYTVKVGLQVPNVNVKPSDQAYDEARQLKESPRFMWEYPESLEIDLFAMKHSLAEGHPFVFGLTLFKGWDVAKKRGYVPMPNLETEDVRESHGDHAMLCVGYKDSAKVFIVRNSWGPTWGDKGYCYIPYDYMTNPEFCDSVFKINGHPFGIDLAQGVWKKDDGDFDEAFYEIPPKEVDYACQIFELEEAIAVICYMGIGVDGISPEEQRKLFDLFEEYKIDPINLKERIYMITQLPGMRLKTCYNAAVKIIHAYNEAMLAFQISAEFAFADGKFSRREQMYWDRLAMDLAINKATADSFIEYLFKQNPGAERDWTILAKPIGWRARGKDVTRLQEALVERGYKLKVSGMARLSTLSAVLDFQKKNGLKADGIVGQDTWDALFVQPLEG